MSNGIQDLQMLRLIKAFQKIERDDTRRMILTFVEQQAQKEQEQKLQTNAG